MMVVCVGIVVAAAVVAAPGFRIPGRAIVASRADRRSITTLSAIVVAGVFAGPVAMIAAALVGYVHSVLQRRNHQRDRERQVHAGLAEVVDLFAVALAGGHNLYAATQRVAQWSSEPFRSAFVDCVGAAEQGLSLGDSFEDLPARLGPAVQPLAASLVAHERYGAPIVQNLATLASESRRTRRHHAEVLARRLPVVLLGPLVICVLPAFLLLTVVPLVAETIGSFTESFGP